MRAIPFVLAAALAVSLAACGSPEQRQADREAHAIKGVGKEAAKIMKAEAGRLTSAADGESDAAKLLAEAQAGRLYAQADKVQAVTAKRADEIKEAAR